MTRFGSRTIAKLLFSLALLATCRAASRASLPDRQAVSWEVFKSSAARTVDGRVIYVVEWDSGGDRGGAAPAVRGLRGPDRARGRWARRRRSKPASSARTPAWTTSGRTISS